MAVDDWNRRFYQKINDIRRHCGMQVINYPCDPVAEEDYGGRNGSELSFDVLKQTTEATIRSQKEAQLEVEQSFDGSHRIAKEQKEIAEEQRRIADQKLRKQESDRRFYKNLNEIRAYLGMPPIDYLCDSIGSGAIIDQGEQDAELCQSKTDSRPGQEYEASTVSKIQMESPILPDSTDIIDREEIEGQPFDSVNNLPEFKTDEPEELRQVKKIAIPNGDISQVISANVKCESSRAVELKKPSSPENGDPTIFWGINIDSERPTLFKKFGTEWDGGASSQKLIVEPKENPEVITYPLEIVVEVESDEIYGWADYRMISVQTFGNSFAHHVNLVANEAMISDFKGNSVECVEFPIAPKVFVEMSGLGMVERGTNVSSWVVELSPFIAAVIGKQTVLNENSIFDPGIASLSSKLSIRKSLATTCGSCPWKVLANPHMGRIKTMSLVFDPGGLLKETLGSVLIFVDMLWINCYSGTAIQAIASYCHTVS